MVIDIPEADVFLLDYPGISLFDRLKEETPWQQRSISIYGKTVPEPRLTAWYGDAPYCYSGTKRDPLHWTPTLLEARWMLEDVLEYSFNSVLLNLYRDGRDSIGYHSDDESELGSKPVIASLSFGSNRKLKFKHKRKLYPDLVVDLPDRSLLVMTGDTQKNWKHGIEKVSDAGERINMTFRNILDLK